MQQWRLRRNGGLGHSKWGIAGNGGSGWKGMAFKTKWLYSTDEDNHDLGKPKMVTSRKWWPSHPKMASSRKWWFGIQRNGIQKQHGVLWKLTNSGLDENGALAHPKLTFCGVWQYNKYRILSFEVNNGSTNSKTTLLKGRKNLRKKFKKTLSPPFRRRYNVSREKRKKISKLSTRVKRFGCERYPVGRSITLFLAKVWAIRVLTDSPLGDAILRLGDAVAGGGK